MAEFPAMPLWTDAYIGDTTHLTCEEHGAYLLLLITAWRTRDCRLPDDDVFLARVTRCTMQKWCKIRARVEPFFNVSNGFWSQKRQKKERQYLDSVREKRRAAAHAKHRKAKENGAAGAGANGLQPTPGKKQTPTVENQITVPPTGGTAAPPEAAKAALWREMKAQIGGKDPGSLAGKWAKIYGLAAVTDAHFAAMANPPADYVEWMTKRLQAQGKPYAARQATGGKSYNQLHREMQEETDDEERGSEAAFGVPGTVAILRPGRADDDPGGHGRPGSHLRAVAGGL